VLPGPPTIKRANGDAAPPAHEDRGPALALILNDGLVIARQRFGLLRHRRGTKFCECAMGGQELREMEDGLYSVRLKGFDGLESPPGGVLVLLNGMMLGGGAYS
jgi:hypothetical protein